MNKGTPNTGRQLRKSGSRSSVVRTALSLGVFAAVATVMVTASSGCSTRSYSTSSVSFIDGVPTVDGVRLEHQRVVEVLGVRAPQPGNEADGAAILDTISGPIDVRGGGLEVALQVTIYEYRPNDATVAWTGDRLVAVSEREKPVLIHAIQGILPDGPVFLDTVSGSVTLSDLDAGEGRVHVDTTSGTVAMNQIAAGQVVVDTVSGDVTLDGATGDLLVDTTSATVKVMHGHGELVTVDTVSGAVFIEDTTVTNTLRVESVSGDVALKGGAVGALWADTVSGDLVLTGCEPGSTAFDSTSGEIRVRAQN